jgi:hypothetical protein
VALIVAMEWFSCQAWARFGGELPALAGLEGPDRLLDVGGGAWPAPRLTAWLDAAGLAAPELRRGAGPIAVVRAHAPKP